MIFDEYFDKVVIISLASRPERLEFCIEQLKEMGLSEKFVVSYAIDGKLLTPPKWFTWGAGAWGCLQSHIRVLQDLSLEPDFRRKKILILEDDVLFFKDIKRMFSSFVNKLEGKDWGQIYLGGQHTLSPEEIEPGLFFCKSVNRTHAYAVHGSYLNTILKKIHSWQDYKGNNSHYDQQLERGHRAQLWPVYAPTWWVAGQNCSKSDINGRFTRIRWWDASMDRAAIKSVPFIFIDCDDSDYVDLLYKETIRLTFGEDNLPKDNVHSMANIAWAGRLLPAFEGNELDINFVQGKIQGGVLKLSEVKDRLQEIIDSRVKYE